MVGLITPALLFSYLLEKLKVEAFAAGGRLVMIIASPLLSNPFHCRSL